MSDRRTGRSQRTARAVLAFWIYKLLVSARAEDFGAHTLAEHIARFAHILQPYEQTLHDNAVEY